MGSYREIYVALGYSVSLAIAVWGGGGLSVEAGCILLLIWDYSYLDVKRCCLGKIRSLKAIAGIK